jgi:hypothetical protein
MPVNPNQLDQTLGGAYTKGFTNVIGSPCSDVAAAYETAGRRAQSNNSGSARDVGHNPNSKGSGNNTGNRQNAGNVGADGSGGSTIGGGGNPNNMGGAGGPTAACFKFGTATEGKFVRTIVHHGIFKLLRIETENGHILFVTEEHPFPTADNKLRLASELLTFDSLITKEGPSKIKSITSGGLTYKVFTHEAEEPHTFWANGILVHNKSGGYL